MEVETRRSDCMKRKSPSGFLVWYADAVAVVRQVLLSRYASLRNAPCDWVRSLLGKARVEAGYA